MRGSVFLRFQDLGKEGLTSTATSRLSCFVFLCQQKSKIRFNWVGQSRYHQLVKSYPSWFTIGTIVTILMIIWKVGCIRLDPHCEEHFGAGLGDVRVPGNHHWPDDQGWDQCNPWQIEWSLSASSIFPDHDHYNCYDHHCRSSWSSLYFDHATCFSNSSQPCQLLFWFRGEHGAENEPEIPSNGERWLNKLSSNAQQSFFYMNMRLIIVVKMMIVDADDWWWLIYHADDVDAAAREAREHSAGLTLPWSPCRAGLEGEKKDLDFEFPSWGLVFFFGHLVPLTLSRLRAVVHRPAAMCKEHQYLLYIDKMVSRRQTRQTESF